jgi:ParB family chromosome partitioning protein
MKDNRRLGLGLEALLAGSALDPVPAIAGTEINRPAPSPATRTVNGLIEAGIDELRPNPWQPRGVFDEDEIKSLADSIRRTGMLQPIVARRREGMLEIVAGERRFRAARAAGLARVPVIVRAVDDHDMLQMALVENLHRRDLNPIEKARAFRQLMQMNSWTQDEAADALGLARPTVSNFLRIMELQPEIQDAVSRGAISMGHARALLGAVHPATRLGLLKRILTEDLSVRAVERLVAAQAAPAKPASTRSRDAHIDDLEQRISQHLGTKVEMTSRGKGGTLVIHWYSNEQFNQVLRKLGV